MTDPSSWLTWQERVATAGGEGRDIVQVLRWAAEEIAVACPRGAPPTRRWAATGVDVRLGPMRGRGRCDVSVKPPVVRVNQRQNRFAQQFTVAHEIGHLLVRSLPLESIREISNREEEALCDDLAQRIIIPPDQLADEIDGAAPSPEEILRLCGLFEANPSTLLRALGAQLHLEESAYLLANWRAHYLRPAVSGFRIHAVVGPPNLYWPVHQRIEGLGLSTLAKSGWNARHGTFFEGFDESVSIPLRKVVPDSRHNAMSGPISWEAARQGRQAPYLLARLDCSRLIGERREKKKGEGESPSHRKVGARA